MSEKKSHPSSSKRRASMAVFPWLLYQLFYRAARKMKHCRIFPSQKSSSNQFAAFYPDVSKCKLKGREFKTVVFDINSCLRSSPSSFFPYFMLVCFEGGSIFRAFLLLLSWPILSLLNHDSQTKAMIFISFCGLPRKNMENVALTVLPKFYLENLDLHAFEVLEAAGSRVVFTSVPKIMVEGFLREYLGVNEVIGTELRIYGRYFTGFVSENGLLVKDKALKDYFGEEKPDIGIGTQNLHDHRFISLCKEAYVINKEDTKTSVLPREKYPKPLIFHDGRLAFFPTPTSVLFMFIWIPIGIFLAIFRMSVGIFLPFKLAYFLASLSGLHLTLKGNIHSSKSPKPTKGVLFVCTHRTLLDPVFLSSVLAKPLIAVTYSLSKFSEAISPIKTVRLTRDRVKDGETMQRMLEQGDLVVCPEGTTCREPYLLRFSPLFAELTNDIVPVAIDTRVSMFYGTTASGFKCLDPVFFLMNPRPSCFMEMLPKVPKELTCGGGKSSFEVANYIQRQLGNALGFECTKLTRRDKYLMLAGNEGVVQDMKKSTLA